MGKPLNIPHPNTHTLLLSLGKKWQEIHVQISCLMCSLTLRVLHGLLV